MGRTVNGDDERFTRLFVAYRAPLLSYVRRRVGDESAQDIVAETFLAAWRNLDQLPSQPLPWLYRAAAFEIGHLRRTLGQRERLEHPEAGPAPDPADEVLDADHWARAFRRLSASEREVLRLVAWEQVLPRDGAFVLGCSISAFKVRLHRARKRLTRFLEDEDITAVPAVELARAALKEERP